MIFFFSIIFACLLVGWFAGANQSCICENARSVTKDVNQIKTVAQITITSNNKQPVNSALFLTASVK